MSTGNYKGHLAAIAANIFFGLNLNVTKVLFSASWMTPLGLIITRMIMSLLVFWIIGFFMPKQEARPRELLIIALGGVFGIVIALVSFTMAIRLISPVVYSLIQTMGPIIVLLLSALLSMESITPKKAVGVIIGISGAALIVIQNAGSGAAKISILGICIAFLSVTAYSAHILIIRKVAGKFTPITIMKWMYLWSFILLSPLGIPELPHQRLFTSEFTLLPFLLVGYTAIFASIIGSFLMPIALKRVKATAVSMYSTLQPLTASTAAIIIGQDVFSWDKPLAFILIVTGVFLVTHTASKQ